MRSLLCRRGFSVCGRRVKSQNDSLLWTDSMEWALVSRRHDLRLDALSVSVVHAAYFVLGHEKGFNVNDCIATIKYVTQATLSREGNSTFI
jgi:hypothetical protein